MPNTVPFQLYQFNTNGQQTYQYLPGTNVPYGATPINDAAGATAAQSFFNSNPNYAGQVQQFLDNQQGATGGGKVALNDLLTASINGTKVASSTPALTQPFVPFSGSAGDYVTPAQEAASPPQTPAQVQANLGLNHNTTTTQSSIYSPAAGYTGPSIVDFLKAAGQPNDAASLAALAKYYGIANYAGSAAQNTQLLNTLKGLATGSVNANGTTATLTSTAGSAVTPNSTIDLSSLGNGSLDLSKILGASASGAAGSTTDSSIAGLLSLLNAPNSADQNAKNIQDQVTQLMGSLNNEGSDTAAALESSGYNDDVKNIQQLTLTAAQQQGQLAAFDAETAQNAQSFSDQSIPTALITGQQAQYNAQRALQRNSMAAELASTTALIQAYQGNATIAQQLATQSVTLKYQPIENEITTLQTQLGYATDAMNKADSNQASIINTLLTFKQNEISDAKQTESDIMSVAVQAASNGAPLSLVNQMKAAPDAATAANIGSAYLKGSLNTGSGSGSSGNFSTTQLNSGAANAGMSIADFKNLSADEKNYFINTYSSQFAPVLKDVQDGNEDASDVADEINSSNLSDNVKTALLAKLKPYESSSSSKSGFWSTIWGDVKPFLGL